MHRKNWDDLRFVLAVAETGSISAAARQLGVNHATVLRRVAAFEDREDCAIFERTARGYTVLPDRLRVIEAAREVETAVMTVGRTLRGAQAPLRGRVRVTSTDTFCHVVLPPVIAALQADAADLRLELLCTNTHLNLSRMHADVTVRPAVVLPDELDGEIAAELGFGVYAMRDGTSAGWLGLAGPLLRSRPGEWLTENVAPEDIVSSGDSFLTLREMAAAGMGQAVLPHILGAGDPRLRLLDTTMPHITVPIWVACHSDLAQVPRIEAVARRLRDGISAAGAALRGG